MHQDSFFNTLLLSIGIAQIIFSAYLLGLAMQVHPTSPRIEDAQAVYDYCRIATHIEECQDLIRNIGD